MSWTPDRFEELVGEAVGSLPAWVHDTLDNVEVFVEDSPPPNEPTLLGRYEGVPAYESWWEVPVAEVSKSPEVEAARKEHEKESARRRWHL